MPRGEGSNLITMVMALEEPKDLDWLAETKRQTGTNLRVTEDTALANRLRARRLVEVLQAPQRGRQPATGRPKYILKVFPNADAPIAPSDRRVLKGTSTASKGRRIPWYLLMSFAEAASTEWNRQRSTISKQLDQEVETLESQLRSTRDRSEKKRLADALQTALHADENIDIEINKRVYSKLANSPDAYAEFVDVVDWTAQRRT